MIHGLVGGLGQESNMDRINDLKDILIGSADRLMRLADRLTSDGEPLSLHDKQTLLHTLSGDWLEECQFEQAMAFKRGDTEQINNISDNITEMMKQIS